MEKYVCIHGHFYQPPRENPWLEAVEVQDSAYPYHDWNERITAECYAPNSAARILDGDRRIMDIVSNYAKISFNFGPTLLSWMEACTPSVYKAILDADRLSMEKHGGHGGAIAQAYNHIIMPLANTRDKKTQIIWGIKDFEHRFKRFPEGMWLPETAADLESLDLLAEYGIRFTILAPHQALRVRRKGHGKWRDVSGSRIDPTVPYSCRLPSGRIIDIIFYDGPISKAVAFENILDRGEDLAARILSGFSEKRPWPQVLSLATDGETYGHHKKYGDMALAYALRYLEQQNFARLTNFGEYLERFPPPFEVQIIENTSWSCIHGVERWRNNCGCNSGGHCDWNQEWRGPLREALDWLRDVLAVHFEEKAKVLFGNPWMIRDDYINIILDRSLHNVESFFTKHEIKPLTDEERITALKLLEMERHLLLMYTSCGWFFDELSGLETVQILSYAARAIQLAKEIFGLPIEEEFCGKLRQAKSNIPEFVDGAIVYERLVKTSIISLKDVGAHYALSSLFQDYGTEAGIYSYSVNQEEYDKTESGGAKLAIGRVSVKSMITHDVERISFSVAQLGSLFLNGGVRTFLGEEAYNVMKAEILSAFQKNEFSELARQMDQHFGMHTCSLNHLFRDQKRRVLALITERLLEKFENKHREMYEESKVLMELLHTNYVPVPSVLLNIAALVSKADLQNIFRKQMVDVGAVEEIVGNLKKFNLRMESPELEFAIRKTIEKMMYEFSKEPSDSERLVAMERIIELIRSMAIDVNLWETQNVFFSVVQKKYRQLVSIADKENQSEWSNRFCHLGELLSFNMQSLLHKVQAERHE